MPETITTKDLIEATCERYDEVGKGHIRKICNLFCKIIGENLVSQDIVRIHNVGVFKKKKLATRRGRNPITGESIKIPEKIGIKYQIAHKVESNINE